MDEDFTPIDMSSQERKQLFSRVELVHVTEFAPGFPNSKCNFVTDRVYVSNRSRSLVGTFTVLLVQGKNPVHHFELGLRWLHLWKLVVIDIMQLLNFIIDVRPLPSTGALQACKTEILLMRSLISSIPSVLLRSLIHANSIVLQDINNHFVDEWLDRSRLQLSRAYISAFLA